MLFFAQGVEVTGGSGYEGAGTLVWFFSTAMGAGIGLGFCIDLVGGLFRLIYTAAARAAD